MYQSNDVMVRDWDYDFREPATTIGDEYSQKGGAIVTTATTVKSLISASYMIDIVDFDRSLS